MPTGRCSVDRIVSLVGFLPLEVILETELSLHVIRGQVIRKYVLPNGRLRGAALAVGSASLFGAFHEAGFNAW